MFLFISGFCWSRVFLRTSLLGACALLIIIFPNVSTITSLTGGGATLLSNTITPILMFLKYCHSPKWNQTFAIFIGFVAVVFAVSILTVNFIILVKWVWLKLGTMSKQRGSMRGSRSKAQQYGGDRTLLYKKMSPINGHSKRRTPLISGQICFHRSFPS